MTAPIDGLVADDLADLVAPHLDEARQFNDAIAQMMDQAPSFATPEGLTELRSHDVFGRLPVDEVEERTIPGPGGRLPVRILRPEGQPRAVYVHLHGGGWCIGSASTGDATNLELAQRAQVAVVSVDYRLAPEHPWPAGPDDAEAAASWVLGQGAGEFGTDRLLLGGDSSGAHLAAVTALRLRDRHDAADHLLGANLNFGVFDLGMTPSQRQAAAGLVIPRASLEACYEHLLPGQNPEARRDPAVSPLYADLRELCPALFTVGTLDPLVDDTLFMASRWHLAGNPCRIDVYPEAVHGFSAFPIEIGRIALERGAQWISDAAAAGED